MSQDRQPKGIPAGGQYAPDQHAEPAVTLDPPAPGSETAIGDAVRDREEKMRELKRELEAIHLQGAVDALLRAFPGSVELRASHAVDHQGKAIKGLRGVRLLDADGNDATGGDPQWFYRGSDDYGMSPDYHLYACHEIHRDKELTGYDEDTHELVIRLDRDYWKDGDS